jgi:hypothetical protein
MSCFEQTALNMIISRAVDEARGVLRLRQIECIVSLKAFIETVTALVFAPAVT